MKTPFDDTLRKILVYHRDDSKKYLEQIRRKDKHFNLGWIVWFVVFGTGMGILTGLSVKEGEYGTAPFYAFSFLISMWGLYRNVIVHPQVDAKHYKQIEEIISSYDKMIAEHDKRYK